MISVAFPVVFAFAPGSPSLFPSAQPCAAVMVERSAAIPFLKKPPALDGSMAGDVVRSAPSNMSSPTFFLPTASPVPVSLEDPRRHSPRSPRSAFTDRTGSTLRLMCVHAGL